MAFKFSTPHDLSTRVLEAVFNTGRQRESSETQKTGDISGLQTGDVLSLKKDERFRPNDQKAKQHSEKIQEKSHVRADSGRGLPWSTWLSRGLGIVAFLALLVVFLFGNLVVARWGLTTLNTSAEAKSESLVCQTLDGMGPEIIVVPPGSFQLGAASEAAFRFELPRYSVAIRTIGMSTCEVTFW